MYRDSIILVSGATGTGKTLMVTEYIKAAINAGERAILFGAEESREQLTRNATSWGVDLEKAEKDGLLRIICRYPEVMGLEDHLLQMKRDIKDFNPSRVAVDSMSAFERVSTIKSFREFVIGITSFIKHQEITGLFTNTTSMPLGGESITETHISTITDTIILLRYVELQGEMRRGLTVLKMRGTWHDKQIREYTIDNKGMHNMFGKSREDFIGELLGFSVQEGQFCEIQIWRDGETRSADMHVVQVERNRKPVLLASFRDTTEQRRLADHLRQSQKMEAIGRLAGGIAHDFNNILAALAGNVKLARLDIPIEHTAQVSLAEIEKAVDRATDIVQQILTISRNQKTMRKIIRLEPIIEEALGFLRAVLPAKIKITSSHEDIEPRLVSADPTQIHQVLMNLGTNAAHAMKEHGGQIEIDLSEVMLGDEEASAMGVRPRRYLRLSVSDTGCGMDTQTQRHIFEPFFTTKPSGEGTGLGLSQVHGIMKSHDGAVTVYSEPGKGTLFNLYFPTVEAGVEHSKPESKCKTRHSRGCIMFVDDEEPLVFLAKRMLERQGYEVAGFDRPQEALMAFRAEPDRYDIVITDMSAGV